MDNATRLEFKVRPTEGGRAGELRAYVVAKIAPKTCQVCCESKFIYLFHRHIPTLNSDNLLCNSRISKCPDCDLIDLLIIQCATFPLKPLALHEKVATAVRFEKRAVTSLKISGDFSLPDIHQVNAFCNISLSFLSCLFRFYSEVA